MTILSARRSLIAAGSLLFCAIAVGCSGGPDDAPDTGEVTGTVTLGGTPLANATVTFTPVDATAGTPSIGETDDNGVYELRLSRSTIGAVIGEHTVSVTTAGIGEDANGNEINVPETVPAQYNVNTTLKKTVEGGPNVIDLQLESGGEIVQPSEEVTPTRSANEC